MWIIRTIECWVNGHNYIDVTADNRPYHYCLHCSKVEEPAAVVINRVCTTKFQQSI